MSNNIEKYKSQSVGNYIEQRFGEGNSIYKTSANHALYLQKQELIAKIEEKIEQSLQYIGLSEYDFCQQQGFLEGLREAIEIIKK